MFGIEKVYALMMSDPNIELVTTRKGRKYTRKFYNKGILHIVVSFDNTTMQPIAIKIHKIYD